MIRLATYGDGSISYFDDAAIAELGRELGRADRIDRKWRSLLLGFCGLRRVARMENYDQAHGGDHQRNQQNRLNRSSSVSFHCVPSPFATRDFR